MSVVGSGRPVREDIIRYVDYTKRCNTKQCHSCQEKVIWGCCTTSNVRADGKNEAAGATVAAVLANE